MLGFFLISIMKKFIIEIRVNPFDEFKKYKQFKDLKRATQSFEMLKKHIDNLAKNSEYMIYRLYDIEAKKILLLNEKKYYNNLDGSTRWVQIST